MLQPNRIYFYCNKARYFKYHTFFVVDLKEKVIYCKKSYTAKIDNTKMIGIRYDDFFILQSFLVPLGYKMVYINVPKKELRPFYKNVEWQCPKCGKRCLDPCGIYAQTPDGELIEYVHRCDDCNCDCFVNNLYPGEVEFEDV